LVLNLPFKALMFLTLMRPSLVLFLVLWLKLVKDFLKVRCRLALLPFLISCLIWLDLVASLPLIKERILVIILQIGRASCRERVEVWVVGVAVGWGVRRARGGDGLVRGGGSGGGVAGW